METQVSEIAAKLAEVNELIAPYKLAYVHVDDMVPMTRNAHYMDKDVYENLVTNIKNDGFLSQLPFCTLREDGKYLILSGHHRHKAAVAAGLEHILILYVENISHEKMIAYQLSHNSLVGKDDLGILRQIFDDLKDLDMKEFSGISDNMFEKLKAKSGSSIGDSDIDLVEMKLLFIERVADDIKGVIAKLEKIGVDDNTCIAVGCYDSFIEVMAQVKEKLGIKSNTIAFRKMVNICKSIIEHQEDEETGLAQEGES